MPSKKPFRKKNTEKPNTPDYNIKKINKLSRQNEGTESIRLNRYIANAGICSRRDADQLIQTGQIKVNDKVIKELGTKVAHTDKVYYQGKLLTRERQVYILLNKPRDFITTTKDESNRKTVMSLVKNACDERIYPVGRLDRNTTGLLLLTNDGNLSKKLTHPSHKIKKLYQIELNRPLLQADMDTISEGVELEDGMIKVDDIAIVTPDALNVGVEIHSGKNRIVRRIFESLGYEVIKLDRIMFAGLTKKNLPRGKWRFITEKELSRLKLLK